MTNLVQSLKVGGTSYSIRDSKAVPYLSAADEIDLECNGTYRGKILSETTRFVTEAGTVVEKSAISTWTASTLPTSASWQGVAYGDGKFVAVAYGSSTAAYSTDGITWTAVTMPSSAYWEGVAYGGGKFVAVAYGSSTAAYSTDGITWTATTMPASANWQNVTYGGGKFVAVRTGSTAAYSTDGINWTATTMPASLIWIDVTYGNGKFVATPYNSASTAAYSTDGITWTASTLPSAAAWNGVTYGDGKFVAVNDDGSAAYSTDGINWTAITMSVSEEWNSVTYGDGKFVAVAKDSAIAAYSIDGINWTASALPVLETWNSVTYGDGNYVAVAQGTSTAAVIELEIKEYAIKSDTDSLYQSCITRGEDKFVSLPRRYTATATYSTDGINWTAITMPKQSNWYGVTYGNGKYVAVANRSAIAAYSTDGINWTASTLPASVSWYGITYGDGKFVAVASDTDTAAYSTDGINWTATTMPVSEDWEGVTYGGGKFVAVAYGSSTTAYSTDGITWTASTLPSSASWNSIAYGGGKFVAVAAFTDTAAYSTDGITWTATTMPTTSNGWFGVAYGGGMFVAVRSSSPAAYSPDGINWTAITMSTVYWTSVTYGDGKFVGSLSRPPYIGAFKINFPRYSKALSYSADEVDAKLVASGTSYKGVNTQSMTGTTDPTSSTEASIGTLYVNTTTSTPFICVNNTMTPTYTLTTESSGYATVTNGILTTSAGYAEVAIPQIPSNSNISYVTKVKIKGSVASLTHNHCLFIITDNSNNSFGLYLLSSGVFALSAQVNGSWTQKNSAVTPIVGSYVWLAFSIGSNGYVTSSVSLDGESWQQLCSTFSVSSASGYVRYIVGDQSQIESDWENDTDLNATHLYVNGVEEKLYSISDVSWSEL